jgi:hypothetical protein
MEAAETAQILKLSSQDLDFVAGLLSKAAQVSLHSSTMDAGSPDSIAMDQKWKVSMLCLLGCPQDVVASPSNAGPAQEALQELCVGECSLFGLVKKPSKTIVFLVILQENTLTTLRRLSILDASTSRCLTQRNSAIQTADCNLNISHYVCSCPADAEQPVKEVKLAGTLDAEVLTLHQQVHAMQDVLKANPAQLGMKQHPVFACTGARGSSKSSSTAQHSASAYVSGSQQSAHSNPSSRY